MKISLRISLILSVISSVTIVILTILMHFRYHITRTDLINDRIGVTGSSISAIIDKNLSAGISISSQNNIDSYINKYKNIEEIIKDIYVVENKNWHLVPVYKTNSNNLSEMALTQATNKIKATKALQWSFHYLDAKENINFVGFTIKNPSGAIVGAVLIGYDALLLKKQEKKEIDNLYKRMVMAIISAIIVSFLIGYKTTQKLSRMINSLNLAFEQLKKNKTDFDLSQISDPIMKSDFRKFLTFSCQIQNNLNKIDKLTDLANKDSHEYDKI